jgi:hypothetical protein
LRLLVIAAGKAARAQVSSYCLTTRGHAVCGDAAYDPHPRPVFRVARSSTVVACAARPAKGVLVSLLRARRNGPEQVALRRGRRLDDVGQCWRVRLPRHLRGASSLDFQVRYGSAGSADFVVGIEESP